MGFGRYRFRRAFGQVRSAFRGARRDTYPLSYTVSGGGTTAVNGEYFVSTGTYNGKQWLAGPGEEPATLYAILWDGSTWIMAEVDYVTSEGDKITSGSDFVVNIPDSPVVLYNGWGTGNLPDEGQGNVVNGTPPAPTIER